MKTVNTATYKKLVKFGNMNGSPNLIGTVIGSVDEKTIQAYLSEMKSKDAALHKKWGSKWKPEEDDDDDDDPTANLEDDSDDDPTADLEDAEEPDEEPAPPPRAAPPVKAARSVQVGIDREGNGFNLAPGTSTSIPEVFKLRDADGMTTVLEVFSRSAQFGYLLRIPVVTDMRSITIGGKVAEVDLLELRRDPDAMSTVNGKVISNAKLIAAIELAM